MRPYMTRRRRSHLEMIQVFSFLNGIGAKRVSERRRLLCLSDADLLAECHRDYWRASGPGGQKRNKTDSAVRLRHHGCGLLVTSSDTRSRAQNTRRAVRRLREAIALRIREPVETQNYHVHSELLAFLHSPQRGTSFQRDAAYLIAIAELLDVFIACQCAIGETSKCLGVRSGLLSRFIRRDDRLIRRIGELRIAAGLRPLRWTP